MWSADPRVGASTSTNFVAICRLLKDLHAEGAEGSIVTLLCDSGELYRDSYYSPTWLETNDYDLTEARRNLEQFWQTGKS